MNITKYTEGMKIEPGMIVSGMPNHIYHGLGEWYGSTDIKNGLRSIEYFNYKKNNRETLYSVPVEFGTGFHSAMESVLDTGSYDQYHDQCETHEGKSVTKKFRELKDAYPEKAILREGEPEEIERISKRVIESGGSLNIFENGFCELSFFWIDKKTGTKCKCRPDYFRPDIPLMIDYKTTKDHTEQEFPKSIANRNYHLSAAWYMEGVKVCTGLEFYSEDSEEFVFIAVANTAPHEIEFYSLKKVAVDEGNYLFRSVLDSLKSGKQDPQFKTISIPFWAMTHIEKN